MRRGWLKPLAVEPAASHLWAYQQFPCSFTLAQGVLSPISASSCCHPRLLDQGYRQMYNLEFNAAHKTFQAYSKGASRTTLWAPPPMARRIFLTNSTGWVFCKPSCLRMTKNSREEQKPPPDAAAPGKFDRGDSEKSTVGGRRSAALPQRPQRPCSPLS